MKLRFFSLWAINAALNDAELCCQLDLMRGWGFDGVVFHPRFYPNEPAYLGDRYMAVLSRVILHAKSLGMDFWLYDENGWPSGTVGGELVKSHPEDTQQWADLVTEEPADCLGSFKHGGRCWYVARRFGAGVDYLNPNLARHFLEMTHERYMRGLSPAAFEHVSAFFCDEPEFGLGHAYDALSQHGAIPWTRCLPELYRERYGEDLRELLPLLFFPIEGAGSARVRFWELLTDVFCQSFINPLDEWCRQYGKRFTAHVKGEEHPLFQVPTVGSCHQVFQHLALPGIDALERHPSGHFFPRQVASVARQFGNGDCMAEAFGGAGWGASPEDLERYLIWLAGHGINHFVMHLYQQRLGTNAIRDWPPSQPAHLNWREAYPEVLERVRRYASTVSTDADTLVVTPYRGIMAEYEPRELLQTNVHNAATYPETPAGLLNTAFLKTLDRVHRSGAAYHVSDERTVEQSGRFEEGRLRLGRCTYREVVLAEGLRFDTETRRLLAPLVTQRGFEPLHTARPPEPAKVTCDVAWEFGPETVNDLVLEAEAVGDSLFVARFEAASAVELEFLFADDVSAVMLNGAPLDTGATGSCAVGPNEVRFESRAQQSSAFLSARGRFSVRSLTPYATGPNCTTSTAGPFVIDAARPADAGDLVAAGYPFCREPLIMRTRLKVQAAANSLRLADVRADCARVRVDGTDCGWCWGPDWTVRLPDDFRPGLHQIEVRLTPNTFNFYGPHHHIDGDPLVVSPGQYAYRKNFADRPDAPADTRANAWHFKPVRLGGRLDFILAENGR